MKTKYAIAVKIPDSHDTHPVFKYFNNLKIHPDFYNSVEEAKQKIDTFDSAFTSNMIVMAIYVDAEKNL